MTMKTSNTNMKTKLGKTIRTTAFTALLLVQTSALLWAEDAALVRYEALPTGSKMRIAGTADMIVSTKNWHMDGILIGGFLEVDAKFPESALTDAKAAKPTASVFMPVRSFKSDNGAAMDGRMQKEMKEPQFKRIEYKLIELKPVSPAGSTGALKFDALGTITAIGKTHTNTMPITIEKAADGKLKITGVAKVKMTNFGLTPPSTMGLFTSGDEVTLTFEWLTAPKAK